MKDLKLSVRVQFSSEDTEYVSVDIEIPVDTSDDDLMSVMMKELGDWMLENYGDCEEWDEGEISWTLYDWE